MKKPAQHLTRRDFLKLFVQLTVGAGASSLYATFVEPGWVEVTEHPLKLQRLPAAFSGFRLAHIADLHFGGWLTPERFRPALDLIDAQKPDAIAITGDFVHGSWDAAYHALDAVKELFRTVTQRIPTFAVLGNHDHWTDAAMVRRFLSDSGIRELRNDVFAFEKAGEHLYLCGVDDIWERKQDLKAITSQLSPQDCAILLAHEPDFADQSAATGQFELQLSGHSHGGQLVIPLMRPPMLPPWGTKYHTGLYQVGTMRQYTTRGLGMVNPPIRFNCRPEISMFTLL